MADEKKESSGSILWEIMKTYFNTTLIPQIKSSVSGFLSELTYIGADYISNVLNRRINGQDALQIRRGSTTSITSSRNKMPSTIVTAPTQSPNNGPNIKTSGVDVAVIWLKNVDQANDVKARMLKCFESMGCCRVADYYSACSQYDKVNDTKTPVPLIPHFRFGWNNPSDIHYRVDRNGYWFDMPNPVEVQITKK